MGKSVAKCNILKMRKLMLKFWKVDTGSSFLFLLIVYNFITFIANGKVWAIGLIWIRNSFWYRANDDSRWSLVCNSCFSFSWYRFSSYSKGSSLYRLGKPRFNVLGLYWALLFAVMNLILVLIEFSQVLIVFKHKAYVICFFECIVCWSTNGYSQRL